MVDLNRSVITWGGSGIIGGGVQVVYDKNLAGPANVLTAWKALYDNIKTYMPDKVTISYPTSGDTIDSVTGHLTGSWSIAGLAATTGSNTNAFPNGVGASVRWNTGIINPGKPPKNRPFLVRGRTYFVPLAVNAYDTDGTLAGAFKTALDGECNALVSTTGGNLGIWSRNTTGAANGLFCVITGHTLRDKTAMWTGRRD